jgi:hypothetical protein
MCITEIPTKSEKFVKAQIIKAEELEDSLDSDVPVYFVNPRYNNTGLYICIGDNGEYEVWRAIFSEATEETIEANLIASFQTFTGILESVNMEINRGWLYFH